MQRWQRSWMLALGLLVFSALVYGAHYWLFRDGRTLLFYLLFDVAFVPIQVLLVSLILERLLRQHEKETLLNKMNMAIGVFFNELGTDLLQRLAGFGSFGDEIATHLAGETDWSGRDWDRVRRKISSLHPAVDSRKGSLAELRTFLSGQREFLLRLLQNPSLLEHETFTDMLWAVFHLEDELAHRSRLAGLPARDLDHLSGDMQRAVKLLMLEWLGYIGHLRGNYPYLFSLAVRSNPFLRTDVVLH